MNICGMISFGAFSASSYLVWSEDVNNLNGFIWVSELVFISNSFDSSLHDNEYELKEVVLLLPLLLAPLVDSNSDASTFPILRFDQD